MWSILIADNGHLGLLFDGQLLLMDRLDTLNLPIPFRDRLHSDFEFLFAHDETTQAPADSAPACKLNLARTQCIGRGRF